MSEAKHTPGPWLADGASVYEERDDFSVICNFWSSSLPEWEANARLTAAAPDLLEALEELADMLSQCTFQTMRIKGQYVDREEAVYRARAAIAKAKGEE